MGDSPSGGAGAEGATAAYPPDIWLDLAVQLLAELPGNAFTPQQVMGSSGVHARTRHPPCCVVGELPRATPPLYFGREAEGYVVVSPTMPIEGWPTSSDGTFLPVRLARWMVHVGHGLVARHTCDTPSCIARAHLVPGTHSENVRDCIVRRRRRSDASPLPSRTQRPRLDRSQSSGPAASPATCGGGRSVDASKDVLFPMTGFLSPSKKARKMHRRHPYARTPRAARLAARIPLAPPGG